jgi:ABC-type transport system involved in multi-copper enzyme maturation permease subunit
LALLGEGAIVLAGWVALALAAGNMIFTRRRLL